MNDARKVLIAGCGYVGEALGARLARRDDVVGWRRHPSGEALAFPIEARDLARPATYGAVDYDHILFCAAPSNEVERGERAYRTTYVETLERLLGELDRRSPAPARFVFVSSTAVYGDRAGEWVDEASSLSPDGYRGEVLIVAEELVRTVPFSTAIVRLSGIYGPGRARWIESLESGRARPRAAHWTNRMHRDDCVGLLERVLDRPDLDLVIGVDLEPTTELTLAAGLTRRLGLPAPVAASDDAPTGRRCRSTALAGVDFQFRHPTWREGYEAILSARLPGSERP